MGEKAHRADFLSFSVYFRNFTLAKGVAIP